MEALGKCSHYNLDNSGTDAFFRLFEPSLVRSNVEGARVPTPDLSHSENRTLARQTYWQIRLSIEPKIPTLCTSQRPVRTTKRPGKYIILPVLTCSLQSVISACDGGAFGLQSTSLSAAFFGAQEPQ